MKKVMCILTVCFLISFVSKVFALDDWYINSDQLIQDGDYGNIWIYDNPPEQTIVDMLGGSALSVNTNDNINFNLYGGIVDVITMSNSSTVNLFGGDIESIYVTSATINVYGYDFNIGNHDEENGLFDLSGFWEDGNAFNIHFNRAYFDQNTFLHEIPEPGSLFLLITGVIFLREK